MGSPVAGRGALPPVDVASRERRVHAQIEAHELDALLITSATNIRWLTGFTGSNALVVATGAALMLLTDSRYAERAPDELAQVASTAQVCIEREKLGAAVRQCVGGAKTVGLEADHVTWTRQREIAETWLPHRLLVPTAGLIDGLRAAKQVAEIARIEAAAGIVDRALGEVVSQLLQRPTERDFARELDAAIRAGGADDLGFDTIVASGANGARPHHSPGDRTIAPGDLVIVDVGARVDGYRSDMTRTFCIGPMNAEQRRQYDTVLAAQQAGVDAMVDGGRTADVDRAARDVIDAAGWADAFTHGTGHGVGLDIHELPRVARGVDDTYALGVVATVEPGVYLPGRGGVRIEDTCVVNAAGARRLTGFPKDAELLSRLM